MLEKLIIDLFNKNCIKFGNFKLKDGSTSNIYIDLKNIISYPFIFNTILEELYKKIQLLEFTKIVGIPYGGLVLSSALCSKYSIPMILMRKEPKKYGLKKFIEGEYIHNDKCLIIKDTIKTGTSALNFINTIKNNKLLVNDVIVICDRRIGNKYDFNDIKVHSIFTIKDIITILFKHFLINIITYNSILTDITNISYQKYRPNYDNHVIKKILNYVKKKENNFCFDTNYTNFKDLVNFIEVYNNKLCIIKIYSNLIIDFDKTILIDLSKKYEFIIIEGHLFNYSENIFFTEYTKDKIYEWCDIIELSDLHSNNIPKIIDEINTNTNNNVSIIYNIVNCHNKLLYILNKNKNIIGLNKAYIDCDILIFDTLDNKNPKSNIKILENHNYCKNKKLISLNLL